MDVHYADPNTPPGGASYDRSLMQHFRTAVPQKKLSESGRMVYDWDGKEQELYGLYVEQKKSLDEVMELMKDQYDFTPRYGHPVYLGDRRA